MDKGPFYRHESTDTGKVNKMLSSPEVVKSLKLTCLRLAHGDDDLANEIFSRGILKALEKKDQFNGKCFKAWIGTIFKNTAISLFRTSKNRSRIREETLTPYLEISTRGISQPEDEIHMSKIVEIIKRTLPDEWNFLVKQILDKRKQSEIAQDLGCNLGTLKSQIHAARQSIIREVEKRGLQL